MTTFYVLSASSGSSFLVGQVVGSGSPRIFNGDAIYLYRLSGALWTTRDYGENWINIIPLGLTWISTLCQTSGSSTSDINLSNITYVTGIESKPIPTIPTRYQNYPEITAWNNGSPISSGNLSDSVSSTSDDFHILIGNIKVSNVARVWRTSFYPPYAAVKSDAGLPVTARITDLDLSE